MNNNIIYLKVFIKRVPYINKQIEIYLLIIKNKIYKFKHRKHIYLIIYRIKIQLNYKNK
jgi:hypothetical protein